MIIKKTRIRNLNCLSYIADGEEVIASLQEAERFKDTLIKIGFSKELRDGERILPLIVNPTTKRNAEKFYIPDRSKPKETYYQTQWWTRQEWAGRDETREVTDYVDIPRKRYPRIEFLPYSIELVLKYNDSGNLMVLADPIVFCDKNEKLLVNTINIFLTCFRECEILNGNLNAYVPVQTIRLNWEVLPEGEYPWNRMKDDLGKITEVRSKTAKKILFDKCELINSFRPDFRAYGKSGFRGYVIFGFKEKNLYVLESIYPDNATYVFGEDWKVLSRLSKAEILQGNLHDVRLIHNDNWKQEINILLEDR